MSSKQLDSILKNVPSATATGELNNPIIHTKDRRVVSEEIVRIVACIPKSLKREIKEYISNNRGETEATVILRGLQKMGFKVDNSLLVDKRSTR